MANSSFSVSGDGLQALFADALAAGAALQAEEPAFVSLLAEQTAERAKQIVSPMSRSIPPSIHVEPRGVEAAVVAGGSDVPLAAVFERARGTADEFRHPLFGNRDVWYDQFRVRFFSKARAQQRAQTGVEAGALLARTAESRGFPSAPLI